MDTIYQVKERTNNWDPATGMLRFRQTNIGDLKSLIQRANTDPVWKAWKHIVIYADRVEFDFEQKPVFGVDMSGRESFTLVCRQWNFRNKGKFTFFDLGGDPQVRVQVLAQELLRDGHPLASDDRPLFLINGEGDDEGAALALDAQGVNCAVQMDAIASQALFRAGRTAPSDWTVGSDFYWLLLSTFQQAVWSLASEPSEARSMLRWLQSNTTGITWGDDTGLEMPAIGIQAASQLTRMDRPKTPYYVPKLGLAIQRELISTDASEASALESKFNQYLEQKTDLETRRTLAKQIQGEIGTRIDVVDNKIENLRENKLKPALAEMKQNIKAFDQQRAGLKNKNDDRATAAPGPLERARAAFETKIHEVEKNAEAKLFMTVFEGVVTLGAAVATGGAGAVGEVSQVGKIAQLIDQLKKVVELLESLDKLLNAANAIADAAGKVEGSQATQSAIALPDSSAAASMTQTEWKTLRERWDAALDPLVSNDELGAVAASYRAEGRVLLIYGQAAMNARITIADLQGQLVELMMNRHLWEAQNQRIQAFIDNTRGQEDEVDQVALLLQQRYLATKRELLLEIQAYNDAYRYWALDDAPSAGIDLRTTLADIAGMAGTDAQMAHAEAERLQSFTSLSKPAQCRIFHTLSEDDKQALQAGEAVHIPVDFGLEIEPGSQSRLFSGYERVRVMHAEVYFGGFTDADGLHYHATITDNGVYRDRWKSLPFDFVSEATLVRPSAHQLGDFPEPEADHHGFKNSISTSSETVPSSALSGSGDPYYQPTVFTTWSVQLEHDQAENNSIPWDTSGPLVLLFDFEIVLMQA